MILSRMYPAFHVVTAGLGNTESDKQNKVDEMDYCSN